VTIHKNYLKLTDSERVIVDTAIKRTMNVARDHGLHLHPMDAAERAAEALATWLLESR
jgi:hypothetical protein